MNENQKLRALQIEFDEILTCIKPLYLNWKILADRNFITAWIRKLTNLNCSTVDLMHLRNLYLLAMFDSMRKEILPDPFNSYPPLSDLAPLPSHLKDLIEKYSIKPRLNPDWLGDEEFKENQYIDKSVEYEEDERRGTSKIIDVSDDLKNNASIQFPSMIQGQSTECQNNVITHGDNFLYAGLDNNWSRHNPIRHNTVSDFKMRDTEMNNIGDYDTFNHILEQPDNYEELRSRPKNNEISICNKVQEKEMERRLAQLQNSYHEDIMKLRSQHDIEIQSLINRKNIEMEQLRKDCNEKINEQEYHMDQLETKANECMKQLQLFQENKLKEIEQMKKSHSEQVDDQNRHHEQKVLALYEDFQKEKKQLISEQKKKEDVTIKETQEYFAKVKNDFSEKSAETNKEILLLEKDFEELKYSKKKIVEEHEQLTVENHNLMTELKKLQTDLDDSQKRYQFIENQHNRLLENHDYDVKSLKDTLEIALHKAECARDEIEAKAHNNTSILEKQIELLEKSICDLKQNHKNEIEAAILIHTSEMTRNKQLYENEIENFKTQLKNNQISSENHIMELEKKMELKEIQFTQLNKELQVKDKLNVQAIEDLKHEMTLINERQIRKKQFEFEQIEAELKYEIHDKSKEVTGLMQQLSNHKQETEVKLSEIRKWSDNQISVLTIEWKQEKTSIEREYESQLQKAIENYKKDLEKVKEEKDKTIIGLQSDIEAFKKTALNQKSEYEEIIISNKKQIADLVKSHDEEKERLDFHNQIILDNFNQQSIDWKATTEKKHADQVSQILVKTNEKLKEIEHEYEERSLQSFKLINDLKSVIERLKKENQDLKMSYDEQLTNLSKKYHSDIENYQKIIKTNLETYKKEIVNEQIKHKELEKLLERKEHNAQLQLTQLKSEFEARLSKLLSIDVQIDFEETIQSLRCQITFLQQRIIILEDEVDTVNLFKPTQNNFYLKPKCDKIFEE